MKNYFKYSSIAGFVKNFSLKAFFEGGVKFFERKVRWFVFCVLFLSAGYCVYFWYFFIYQSSWSEARKEEYAKAKEQGVVFNEKSFNDIVAEIKKRKDEYEKNVGEQEDIFRLGE